jgi:hypothetical protein
MVDILKNASWLFDDTKEKISSLETGREEELKGQAFHEALLKHEKFHGKSFRAIIESFFTDDVGEKIIRKIASFIKKENTEFVLKTPQEEKRYSELVSQFQTHLILLSHKSFKNSNVSLLAQSFIQNLSQEISLYDLSLSYEEWYRLLCKTSFSSLCTEMNEIRMQNLDEPFSEQSAGDQDLVQRELYSLFLKREMQPSTDTQGEKFFLSENNQKKADKILETGFQSLLGTTIFDKNEHNFSDFKKEYISWYPVEYYALCVSLEKQDENKVSESFLASHAKKIKTVFEYQEQKILETMRREAFQDIRKKFLRPEYPEVTPKFLSDLEAESFDRLYSDEVVSFSSKEAIYNYFRDLILPRLQTRRKLSIVKDSKATQSASDLHQELQRMQEELDTMEPLPPSLWSEENIQKLLSSLGGE